MDAVHEGLNPASVGWRIVLPASITSSPRFMQRNLQDALALLRIFGGSNIFLTFPANPHWQEIEEALLPGQNSQDCPDLLACVFHLKVKSLLTDIMEHHVFSHTLGHVYTIEYQKRGLPHIHLILFLHPSARLSTPQAIDSFISTEFPDENVDHPLLDLVKKHMVHGPCGSSHTSPCMTADRLCSKGFPKPFQTEMMLTGENYVKTRRRDTGKKHNIRGTLLNNHSIVSYLPYLLTKYEAHINVECTTGFDAIKYIYKVWHDTFWKPCY